MSAPPAAPPQDAPATGNDRDAGVVEEICGYLTQVPPRSYFLFAGAGSGKTRTLVEVLRRLTGVVEHAQGGAIARRLRLYGRSIRVVTYTRNAVAVIRQRLGDNELAGVSTIHSFCWDLIAGYHEDIREALLTMKQAKYDDLLAKATGAPRGITPAKQRDLDALHKNIEGFRSASQFLYHPDRNLYGPGALSHTDVLDVTAWLLRHRPTLQNILKDRHPFILIDESQDTMKGVLDVLMELSAQGGLTLGLLGDHRQRIYTTGHADLPGRIPETWAKPALQMNHRSQLRIVTLINKIWEAEITGRTQKSTGVAQHSRTEKTGGVVRLFVGNTALAPEQKVQGERWCAEQMLGATGDVAWSAGRFQTLAIEHRLVATRGSFLDVYEAMALLDRNAAAPSGSGENRGPSVVRLLLVELAELETCIGAGGKLDEVAATEVLRRHDRLRDMPADAAARAARVEEMLNAMNAFAAACADPAATVDAVLSPVLAARLFEVNHRLVAAHADKSPPPDEPKSEADESRDDRMRRGWCKLFPAQWSQLKRYRTYVVGGSVLATHEVVKGSEFKHVMVVMDDEGAGRSLVSYDKLFGAAPLTKADTDNIAKGAETTIDRSVRLLYVTCSRAEESLALVLWSIDPTAALKKIPQSGWFTPDEVRTIPAP